MIFQKTNENIDLGPIAPLVQDPTINEIMVNGPSTIYVERRGSVELTNYSFKDEKQLLEVIQKIVSSIGRHIDENSPMVDARLADGSRVNAIIYPLSVRGPVLTIRKFSKEPFKISDLINFGTLTQEIAKFLEVCVKGKLNIIISGGTGSGKTTLLNCLSYFIPENERILTIEDAAELQLQQKHVIPLESRPPSLDGKGEITIRDLVRNTLRMRPDRIIVGEVRGGETLDMLQAMNTGHDGSLTTVHANSTRDALSRLETMVLMAGIDLPVRAIREQISSAINLIIQISRLSDGTRRITNITEIQGMEEATITMQNIFVFESKGKDEKGKIIGNFKATGLRPKASKKLEGLGLELPYELFV